METNWIAPPFTSDDDDGRERVLSEDACPQCGEDICDNLVWDDDGTFVARTTCMTRYCPPVPQSYVNVREA